MSGDGPHTCIRLVFILIKSPEKTGSESHVSFKRYRRPKFTSSVITEKATFTGEILYRAVNCLVMGPILASGLVFILFKSPEKTGSESHVFFKRYRRPKFTSGLNTNKATNYKERHLEVKFAYGMDVNRFYTFYFIKIKQIPQMYQASVYSPKNFFAFQSSERNLHTIPVNLG